MLEFCQVSFQCHFAFVKFAFKLRKVSVLITFDKLVALSLNCVSHKWALKKDVEMLTVLYCFAHGQFSLLLMFKYF